MQVADRVDNAHKRRFLKKTEFTLCCGHGQLRLQKLNLKSVTHLHTFHTLRIKFDVCDLDLKVILSQLTSFP